MGYGEGEEGRGSSSGGKGGEGRGHARMMKGAVVIMAGEG
jgi:hypothetical protein